MDGKKAIMILLCVTCMAFAQYKWERIYGGDARDQAFSIAGAPDGGFVAAGFTASFPSKCYEIYVVKTDMHGDSVWAKNIGTPFNDYCWSIAPAHDSGYVLLGATDSTLQTGPHDIYLVKINEQGDSVWARVYGDTTSGQYTNDVGHEIEPTNDGGYVIVGSTESYGAGLHDIYCIKIDAAGDTQWTRTYGTAMYETGQAVLQTHDNGYVVAGTIYETGLSQQIWILRLDNNGDTMWTHRYGGTGSENVTDIVQTIDHGFVFVGSTTSYGAGNDDLYLVKVDSLGVEDWSKTYGFQYQDWGNGLAYTSDSGYIIIGATRTSPDPEDCFAWLLKTDGNGDTTWTRFKPTGYGSANGMDVQQTPDNGYIIGAITWEYGGDDDFLIIKTDPDGISLIEEYDLRTAPLYAPLVVPNPYICFARVPGHATDFYEVYNTTGQHVGSYQGQKIGSDLPSGVYFLSPRLGDHAPVLIIKVR
jgi:hypothetical protein